MSFEFGFGGDDIDGDESGVNDVVQKVQRFDIAQPSHRPPQGLDLRETLASLPSQISYNGLKVGENLVIYRRSLFDIRAQLMAEADKGNNNDDLLRGLNSGDLTSGIYEGGFKTWECSVDLADYVASKTFVGNWHIVELGAGSAIPSCAHIQQNLRHHDLKDKRQCHYTLCDYNEDVLKLCTAPNIFFNAYQACHHDDGQPADELDVDLEAVDTSSLVDELALQGMTFSMISGGWGSDLAELVMAARPSSQSTNILIHASETIYSPESLHSFNETLIALLKSASASGIALVAAKQIYFGVGGGVEDFFKDMRRRGATVQTVTEVSTAGVGRVILEVSLGGG